MNRRFEGGITVFLRVQRPEQAGKQGIEIWDRGQGSEGSGLWFVASSLATEKAASIPGPQRRGTGATLI